MTAKLTMGELLANLPQQGHLQWIGLRPARREPLQSVAVATLSTEYGLSGDHFAGKSSKKRQVTLIQAEHLVAVGSMLGLTESPDPGIVRRNLVVAGINLLALKDAHFAIGETELLGTGLCHPCSRMEENLGPGGYNAMRGHGGITARVLKGGTIYLKDTVRLIAAQELKKG